MTISCNTSISGGWWSRTFSRWVVVMEVISSKYIKECVICKLYIKYFLCKWGGGHHCHGSIHLIVWIWVKQEIHYAQWHTPCHKQHTTWYKPGYTNMSCHKQERMYVGFNITYLKCIKIRDSWNSNETFQVKSKTGEGGLLRYKLMTKWKLRPGLKSQIGKGLCCMKKYSDKGLICTSACHMPWKH